ncbi:hypothetical protein A3Q56_03402 [Intoshia linei]|uniref:Mothers against decapentaplegic homolog n=1 Tax=Intoshia linei TaxID=1819745 RepID=A0A177B3K6_9BILA|nr:hypothetical protein A3Q56_03402 [Intoshia linei]
MNTCSLSSCDMKHKFGFGIRPTSAVRKLMFWKQGDEEEKWALKAVDALVKRLKKKRGAIQSLEHAISSKSESSECVTIPRSLDGRLQVSHRKALPHVIYCRVYRWPDLQNHHELKSIKSCKFSFSSKQKDICINPYHYRRIDAAILPPVLVPRFNNFPAVPPPPSSQNSTYRQASMNNCRFSQSGDVEMLSMPQNVTLTANNIFEPQYEPTHYQKDNHFNSINYSPNGFDEKITPPPCPTAKNVDGVAVPYPETEYWSSIFYYELNCRVGEIFHVTNNELVIDGFTDPSYNASRFCLGTLPNVNRNSTVEKTRKHIGKGCRIYTLNGEIFIECLSDSSIFIQSRCANIVNNFNMSTVCKIPTNRTLKVFDNRHFSTMLNEAVKIGYESLYQMTNMCVIRISFVKGWGAEYHRQDVTSTPCWIEIHLCAPLKWIDRVLSQMKPCNKITSVS